MSEITMKQREAITDRLASLAHSMLYHTFKSYLEYEQISRYGGPFNAGGIAQQANYIAKSNEAADNFEAQLRTEIGFLAELGLLTNDQRMAIYRKTIVRIRRIRRRISDGYYYPDSFKLTTERRGALSSADFTECIAKLLLSDAERETLAKEAEEEAAAEALRESIWRWLKYLKIKPLRLLVNAAGVKANRNNKLSMVHALERYFGQHPDVFRLVEGISPYDRIDAWEYRAKLIEGYNENQKAEDKFSAQIEQWLERCSNTNMRKLVAVSGTGGSRSNVTLMKSVLAAWFADNPECFRIMLNDGAFDCRVEAIAQYMADQEAEQS